MKLTVTNRDDWIEARPGAMNHLKRIMEIVFCLFDLEKCRELARCLEKARGFTAD